MKQPLYLFLVHALIANFPVSLSDMTHNISSSDNKSVSHWIMFDYFFHV